MSSNGTLQGFFYHLFSNIYATLFFAVFFGNFPKAHKNIPVFEKWFAAEIQDHISTSF